MAEVLSTSGISFWVEQIIKRADERLLLISPFLKINVRLKELLEEKNRVKIDIRVIYGKNDLQPEENKWLESMTSIKTSFCKSLHAKCYLNEYHALLTSMNLYEYSQVNNYEMGILVSREQDAKLYAEVYEEAKRILRASDEVGVKASRVETTKSGQVDPAAKLPPRRSQPTTLSPFPAHPLGAAAKTPLRRSQPTAAVPNRGFCIRCQSDLPTNSAKPYCTDCYSIWRLYENEDYEELYCHICGNEHTTTMIKPLCTACYRKYAR